MSEEDLFHTLARFHREIALPDMQRLIDNQNMTMDLRFDQVHTLFDGVLAKLERLDVEFVSIKAALARIEARLDGIEGRLLLLESEFQSVKIAVARLEARISAFEVRLGRSERKGAEESEMLELKQQIAMLNGRVAELEARR
jgi:predicted  nucleic acid-binding Zn-ribbon protein